MGRLTSFAKELWTADGLLGRRVAGVDEVGRGALAGSIVGAAVYYDLDAVEEYLEELYEVRDSKKLSEPHRRSAATAIRLRAGGFAIFEYTCQEIDRYGIQPCNRGLIDAAQAWAEAAGCDALVVDGTIRPSSPSAGMRVEVRPRADGSSLAVASASILAKVSRDSDMRSAEYLYPGYGFLRNVGYGSPEHLAALATLGSTEIHRQCFLSKVAVADHG